MHERGSWVKGLGLGKGSRFSAQVKGRPFIYESVCVCVCGGGGGGGGMEGSCFLVFL